MRLRDLRDWPARLPTGPLNAITDVPGVRVGQVTLIEGESTRTGATAILPHAGNLAADPVPAAIAVLNGYGKLAGVTQVQELGEIETPILLTNTLAVGRGIEAVNGWVLRQLGNERITSLNAVVGETNDSRLNDIRAARPTVAEMTAALDAAAASPDHATVAEGAVGAGTGTVSFGWKGGIGTASRVTTSGHVLGVLVQANFGGSLIVAGRDAAGPVASPDGSIMIVVATDAPLDARGLDRVAVRAFGGLARTGAALSHGSGDYAIAFSTDPGSRARTRHDSRMMTGSALDPLFLAAIEAVEEAILNALAAAGTMTARDPRTGRLRRVEAVPTVHLTS